MCMTFIPRKIIKSHYINLIRLHEIPCKFHATPIEITGKPNKIL